MINNQKIENLSSIPEDKVLESKDKEIEDQNSTNQSSIIFGVNTANILNVIPNYNSNKTESTISDLKQELKEQKEVNKLLKDDNFDKKSEDIISFIERNEGEIDDQITRLNNVITDLKSIIIENEKLENEEEKYLLFIESNHCIRVADKILKIKALKEDINFFLEESGIKKHLI